MRGGSAKGVTVPTSTTVLVSISMERQNLRPKTQRSHAGHQVGGGRIGFVPVLARLSACLAGVGSAAAA